MTAVTYDFEFWQRPPMTFRIYVMWALGNLVAVLLAIFGLGWRVVRDLLTVRPVVFVWGVVNDIADAALNEHPTHVPERPVREIGWALREYKERMNSERRAAMVDRRVQGGLPGRVVRQDPSRRTFAWPG